MKALDSIAAPIHREGHIFVAAFFLATVSLFFIFEPLGWAGLVATLWCVYFFRDPERFVPDGEGLAVAPADGVVSLVDKKSPPAELDMGGEEVTRVCIFMNVFNVHVNRMPAAGTVEKRVHAPGLFLNAAAHEAGDENERTMIRLSLTGGGEMAVVQVAGLVARRILCDAHEGDSYMRGERFGLIRFGSRVDVYLPQDMEASVIPGQTMVSGETVIARKKEGSN